MSNQKEESYTLADLADLRQCSVSTVAGYIGMYVVNALADGMPCEELAAELQQFKESKVGQAEIQGHTARVLVCPDSCTLSQDSQGIA